MGKGFIHSLCGSIHRTGSLSGLPSNISLDASTIPGTNLLDGGDLTLRNYCVPRFMLGVKRNKKEEVDTIYSLHLLIWS